ncbi:MAG: cupin domain-containing protein [Acidiferrobacter sp.]
MATLRLQSGEILTDATAIGQRLAPLRVALATWPVPTTRAVQALRAQATLSAAEQEELLAGVDDRFAFLKATAGYTCRDLVVIHEDLPGRAPMLAKFAAIHYHTDDEVRYVLDGRGYFGFVDADGGQMLLEVTVGDYINVPARTEHWFVMRDAPRIKAVRYFIDTAGWMPVYTPRAVTVA